MTILPRASAFAAFVLLFIQPQLAYSSMFTPVEVFLNVTGKVRCGEMAIAGAVVRLVEEDSFCDQVVACTTVPIDGSFKLSGSAKDAFDTTLEPFLEVHASANRRFALNCPCGDNNEHAKMKRIYLREAIEDEAYSEFIDIDLCTISESYAIKFGCGIDKYKTSC